MRIAKIRVMGDKVGADIEIPKDIYEQIFDGKVGYLEAPIGVFPNGFAINENYNAKQIAKHLEIVIETMTEQEKQRGIPFANKPFIQMALNLIKMLPDVSACITISVPKKMINKIE